VHRAGRALVLAALALAPALAGCVQLGDPLAEPDDPRVLLQTTLGNVTVELFVHRAPITVHNFLNYTAADYYNGTVFHRVVQGFVVQGGQMLPNGTLKPPLFPPIPLEVGDPLLTHRDGCVAAARGDAPDSATAQFYFCDGPQHQLDDAQRQRERGERGYAVFGRVVDGLDVVRAIARVPTDSHDRPVRDVVLENASVVG
jgi:cyclophilin family peptidyl-prolyl cis-trans isomerase